MARSPRLLFDVNKKKYYCSGKEVLLLIYCFTSIQIQTHRAHRFHWRIHKP